MARITLERAEFYYCDTRCSSFTLHLRIQNQSDETLCVPDLFLTERASEFLYFKVAGGQEYQQSTNSGSPSEAVEKGGQFLARAYQSGSNYILAPRERRDIEIYTGDNFDVPNADGQINTYVEYFPCIPDDHGNIALKRADMKAPVKRLPQKMTLSR
ncbi:hypothetical protein [Caulobacter sp. DWR1-3-2b1]|uniref:hypothetical protein n=1 Tax=Caulobacter sp. DWR1-3-2b1 TaxID=2804670 RepID=UPI003CF494FE